MGDKLNLSPIKIDYLIEGYTGRVSRYATGKSIQNPFTKEFYLSGGRQIQDFYDAKERNDQLAKSIDEKPLDYSIAVRKTTEWKKQRYDSIYDMLSDYRKEDIKMEGKKIKDNERLTTLRRRILDAIDKV